MINQQIAPTDARHDETQEEAGRESRPGHREDSLGSEVGSGLDGVPDSGRPRSFLSRERIDGRSSGSGCAALDKSIHLDGAGFNAPSFDDPRSYSAPASFVNESAPELLLRFGDLNDQRRQHRSVKIESARSPGDIPAVMTSMMPGGVASTLRSLFDNSNRQGQGGSIPAIVVNKASSSSG